MNTTHIYSKNINENFSEAVRNAQVLVYYAYNNGIDIDEKHLSDIVKAKEFLDKEKVDPALEISFWQALKVLSQKVKPVSIESIHSIFERKEIEEEKINDRSLKGAWFRIKRYFQGYTLKSSPFARRITRRLRGFALLSMLIMLLLQIYWVIGVALINDSHQMLNQIDLQNNRLVFLEDSLGERAAESSEILSLEKSIANLDEELNVRSKVLAKWNNVWKHFPWIFMNGNGTPPSDDVKVVRANFRTNLVQAKFIVDALYSYFLPLLYGLLGAFVFVLRKLANEIKTITYTKESNINYGLRLHLGALAGLAIGWFATPDNSTSWTFNSLSPLAIAFLAGYSVELLFTVMDRLISPTTDQK